jgi:hypothetical protein
MSYPVVNIGTLAAEDVNSYVKNAQYTAALSNGSMITLGALVSGQNGVFNAATPTSVTTQEVLIVISPEIIDVNGYRIDVTDPTLFTNAANTPFTAYHLKVGDTLTITDDGITGTTVLQQYVVPANGASKPAVAADLTGATLLAFQVIEKPTISVGQVRKAATRLLVVKSN